MTHRLLPVATATFALLLAASEAGARPDAMGGGYGTLPPNYGSLPPNYGKLPGARPPGHGGHPGRFRNRGFLNGGVWVVEREVPVYIEREVVVREVPAEPPPPPPAPREPYVIGKSYASLPGGCMKLIEDGASYYYCSGEWYRQMGDGRSATYKAVAKN